VFSSSSSCPSSISLNHHLVWTEMFEKRIVVDCRGHLLGRLSSVIAKELLCGQRVVCVRCEDINISGSLFRNKLKYLAFLNKRTNTNPKRGPFHLRGPSKILWRCIRGMLPHKSSRGAAALSRLKVFEGVPPPYDKMKKMVIPEALRALRLRPGRKYCVLGRLSTEVGWRYGDVINKLEEKRKIRGKAFYLRKKALIRLKSKALEATQKKFPSSTQQTATPQTTATTTKTTTKTAAPKKTTTPKTSTTKATTKTPTKNVQ